MIKDNQFQKIIESILDWMKDNRKIIENISVEDKEVCGFELDFNQLMNVFGSYRNVHVEDKMHQKIFVQYYGNPYITAMLCVEGILNNCEIILGIEDVCYGINKAIVKIINEALKECKTSFKIELENHVLLKLLENFDVDKIVCLGNSNSYMRFRKIKNRNVEYIPLFDISVYYDSEDYENLVNNIFHYATRNFYEIEIFDETEDIDDVIYMINQGYNKYCCVVLSKDLEKQKHFKNEINRKIYLCK